MPRRVLDGFAHDLSQPPGPMVREPIRRPGEPLGEPRRERHRVCQVSLPLRLVVTHGATVRADPLVRYRTGTDLCTDIAHESPSSSARRTSWSFESTPSLA